MQTSPYVGTLAGEPHVTDATTIAAHLSAWQASGNEGCLERAWSVAGPIAQRMIAATLHRRDIHDPTAIDDALSLVLDHLRRLPQAASGERAVAKFNSRVDTHRTGSSADPGEAYIVWLARERAADVARVRRRRARHTIVFSMLDEPMTGRACACNATDDDAALAELCTRLREATPRLPPRERLVIELLLEGKSQAIIAHMLDVCEGTVSRLRTRAIAMLRDMLAE